MANYLIHHGIKGQSWGVRNGPPYPLGANDHSAREKKAGWKSSLDKNSGSKFVLTDKQKKLLKFGAIAAGVALATYGAYKLGAFDALKGVSKDSISTSSLSSITDNKYMDVIKDINPEYSFDVPGSLMNCGNCALATELAFRGEDVSAKLNETGMTMSQLLSYTKNMTSDNIIEDLRPDFSKVPEPNYFDMDSVIKYSKSKADIVDSVLKNNIKERFNGDARGAIFFPGTFGSHWFTFVKEGNDISFLDSQSRGGVNLKDSLFAGYHYHPNKAHAALQVFRLDNVDFDKERLKSVVNYNNEPQISKYVFDTFVEEGLNFTTKMNYS